MTTAPPVDGDALRVRAASDGDLGRIHRIERAAFPQPWPYGAFERYLGDDGFLVAELDGAVVGYAVADTVPNHGAPMGHLKDLAVSQDHRGRGIGSRLVEEVLDLLTARGAGSVKLEVRAPNRRAIALYRDYDFEHRRTIPNYYGNGEDALVMVRSLPSP